MQYEHDPLNNIVPAESRVADSKDRSNLNFDGRISETQILITTISEQLTSFILLNMAATDEVCDGFIKSLPKNASGIEKFQSTFHMISKMKRHIGIGFHKTLCTKGFGRKHLLAQTGIVYKLYMKGPVHTPQRQVFLIDDEDMIMDVRQTSALCHPMNLNIGTKAYPAAFTYIEKNPPIHLSFEKHFQRWSHFYNRMLASVQLSNLKCLYLQGFFNSIHCMWHY